MQTRSPTFLMSLSNPFYALLNSALALILVLLLMNINISSSLGSTTTLNGAGATFPYPIYSKWFAEYNKIHKNIRLNYQSIGSGGGIQQLLAGTVDFGASDVPMLDQEMKKSPIPIIHIPTVLGAVAIVYHLEGVPDGLKLTGELLSKIFMGQITKWNDPLIQKINDANSIKLPNQAILVSHRSDGSGTTAVFTQYLSEVSEIWKKNVGSGKAVKWPSGIGGKGNEGVTAIVKQMNGSIGYVELAYAIQNNLSMAALKNKEGIFQSPTLASISASAKTLNSSNVKMSVVNAAGKETYPLTSATYLLIPEKKLQGEKLKAFKAFLLWALNDGQKMAPQLHYAPLPQTLTKTLEQDIKKW